MSDSRHGQRIPKVEVYWTTITYRSVFVAILLALILAGLVWKAVHPKSFNSALDKITGKMDESTAGIGANAAKQAWFVNLDGKVQVKKVASLQWVSADYQMSLEKGDLIQTGGDGVARINFADGSTYTVKADTLITVESSPAGQSSASKSGVHVSSGAVDLTTTTSQAEVSFEDAVASLNQNSRAAVRSDPEKQQHEITVQAGAAEVQRGTERIQLTQYERVSFPTGGEVAKSRVLAPPELVRPLNLQPIMAEEPKRESVRFEWKPVPGAKEYQLRVSTTAMFSQVLLDKRIPGTSTEISGLEAGQYFWAVRAIDAKKEPSEPSETNNFTLAVQGKGAEMLLETEAPQLHGNVVEIRGRTEPGAALIINGQAVPKISNDGHFQYFLPPMTRGSHKIVISGQNRRGGNATREIPVFIP